MRGHTAPHAVMPDAGRPGSREGAGLPSSSVVAVDLFSVSAARVARLPGEAGHWPAFASKV